MQTRPYAKQTTDGASVRIMTSQGGPARRLALASAFCRKV